MNNSANQLNGYLRFLPAIFHGEAGSLLERFLGVFEKFLTAPEAESFSGILEDISRYFDPDITPFEFLDWLAGWVGLALKQDWEPSKKRAVLANIIPLYRLRGTKRGIEEYLKLYLGETDGAKVEIIESWAPLQVQAVSTVGVDTLIGGLPPYFFIVNPAPLLEALGVPQNETEKLKILTIMNIIQEIIGLEKPAHTYYRMGRPNMEAYALARIQAAESAALLRSQILVQAGSAALAQANSTSQTVLSLFR